jgi:hypothetical protein
MEMSRNDYKVSEMDPQDPTPTKVKDADHITGDVYSHPSFGSMTITRYTGFGGDGHLFGSDITHDNGISISLYESEYSRKLNHDYIRPSRKITEIHMSSTQWAEFITTGINNGGSTPCTINYRQGMGTIANATPMNKLEVIESEIDENVDKAVQFIEDVKGRLDDLLDEKTITKKKLREVIGHLGDIQHMKSNMQFIKDQAKETVQRMATEAKANVEAFVEHKNRQTGLEALSGSTPTLLTGGPEENS